MNNLIVKPVGKVVLKNEMPLILLEKPYRSALEGLDGFSHIQIFWWFDACDNEASRSVLKVSSPYRNSPDTLGTFATRSPERPNPVALSTAQILRIDPAAGIIGLSHIDARDNTPVIDLKPYTPSLDRVAQPCVPDWCASWPKSLEESADFDWSGVFTF